MAIPGRGLPNGQCEQFIFSVPTNRYRHILQLPVEQNWFVAPLQARQGVRHRNVISASGNPA
jgi:hypothetical protein